MNTDGCAYLDAGKRLRPARRLLLALCLALLAPAVARSAPISISLTIRHGWNLVSLQGAPLLPLPPDVFSAYTDDGDTGADAIDGNLYRFNPITSSLLAWDTFTTTWGGMLAGDGFWIYRSDATVANVTVTALDVSGDHWISLPRGEIQNLIGYPDNSPVSMSFADLQVTDGVDTLSIEEARDEGWINGFAYYYSNPLGSQRTTGLEDEFPDKETLDRGEGYWIQANIDDLALIVPGP